MTALTVSHSETMQIWARGLSLGGLWASIAYHDLVTGSRIVQSQTEHAGRVVTLRKHRSNAGVVWSYIFHSENDMHVYESRVSLKEAIIGGLAMARAYAKVYDNIYKKRVINPGGQFPSVEAMQKWTYEDVAGLSALGFKRRVTMTFFDGSHCYLYETDMSSI